VGYATFKSAPKNVTTSDQIGAGQVKLEHLDPALFAELQSIRSHAHTGAGSRRVRIQDLAGQFGTGGFYMYSSDATKKYRVTIDSGTGEFVLTEV
jgi:hypothetical protein